MTKEMWHADIDISDDLAKYCIEAQFKQLTPVRKLICIGEGWDNKVFLVNEYIIFRFPRREIAIELLVRENVVLSKLNAKFDLAIPTPTYLGSPCERFPRPFHGYELLPGQSGCQAGLSDVARKASVAPLAHFLKTLHSITEAKAIQLGVKPQVIDRVDSQRLVIQLSSRIEKLYEKNIVAVNGAEFKKECQLAHITDTLPKEKVLVHGDLYCRHLLFNEGKLTGIIDWGDHGINLPAVDLSIVFSFYAKENHQEFFAIYGDVPDNVKQYARFLGLYSSMTTLLYGVDVGNTLLAKESLAAIKRINPSLLKETSHD